MRSKNFLLSAAYPHLWLLLLEPKTIDNTDGGSLNIYSGWAVVALFAAVLAAVASPLFSRADETGSFSNVAHRIETLDGLRGFLALGVATHHGIIYYHYLLSGAWRAPPSTLFNQLGRASVGLFFIITAYLFWEKALRAKGPADFAALLTGRFFRIAPVYCFLMLVATLVGLIATGFVICEPLPTLLGEGARNFAFGVLPVTPFNGINIPQHFAGVTWTLVYEWRFYLLLPLVAFLPRRRSLDIVIVAIIVASIMSWRTHQLHFALIALFLWGILCAIAKQRNFLLGLSSWIYSTISLFAFSAVYILFHRTFAGPVPAALLAVGFYAILCGGDMFGLLNLKPARRLGAISYDLYLVHGLILATAFAVPNIKAVALSSPAAYWLTLGDIVFVALAAALMLRVFIELPGLAAGRRLRASFAPNGVRQAGNASGYAGTT